MQAPKCRCLVLLVFLMLLAILLPSNVLAVALGKIQVSSHLGEPFYAEIPFALAQSEAIAKLSIELATPDEYRMLEVYRPSVLNELTADIKTHNAGDSRVQLSSTSIIRSPYLNVILKVKYGRATHFKKLPVVLDLPAEGMRDEPLPTVEASAMPNAISMPIAPIIQAPVVTAATPVIEQALATPAIPVTTNTAAEITATTNFHANPCNPYSSKESLSALPISNTQAEKTSRIVLPASHDVGISLLADTTIPASAASSSKTVTATKKAIQPSSTAIVQRKGRLTAGRYGPAKAGDSIISIARRMNIASRYSLQQIMASIYRANPASFEKQNMNLLMKGAYLDLPTATKVERISKVKAIRLVAQHDRAFSASTAGKHYVSKIRVAKLASSNRVNLTNNPKRGSDGTAAPYAVAANSQSGRTAIVNNKNGNAAVFGAMAGDAYTQVASSQMMQALRQQTAVLQQQLVQTQKQLAAVKPALANKNAELQTMRQQLAEKDAEILQLNEQAGFMGGIMGFVGAWGLIVLGVILLIALLAVIYIFGMRFMRKRKSSKPVDTADNVDSYDEQSNQNNSDSNSNAVAAAVATKAASVDANAEERTLESTTSELAGDDFADNFSDTMAQTIGPNDGFSSPVAEESGTAASQADADDFMDDDVNAFFEGSGSDIGGELGSTLEGRDDLEATGMLDSASIPELTDQDTSEMQAFEEDIEDEPDPDVNYLAEADVYLRYGMEDEAAHHVKMALKQEPTSVEAHIKLLQILTSMNDEQGVKSALTAATLQLRGAALERYKSEVAELDSKAGSKTLTDTLEDTIRTHAEQMLKSGNNAGEIAKQPQEQLQEDDFSITTQAGEAVLPVEADDTANDLQFSPAESTASSDDTVDTTTAAVEDELDFDNFSFSDDSTPEEDAAAGQDTQAETEAVLAESSGEVDDLDFDLGGMSFGEAAASEDTLNSDSSSKSDDAHDLGDDDDLDLDFDLSGMELGSADSSDDANDNDDSNSIDSSKEESGAFSLGDNDGDDLDFDISGLGLDDTTTDASTTSSSTTDSIDVSDENDLGDLGDMEFDLTSLGLDDTADGSSDTMSSATDTTDGDALDFDLNFDDPGDDHPKAEAARGAELSGGNAANEDDVTDKDNYNASIDAPGYITSTMPFAGAAGVDADTDVNTDVNEIVNADIIEDIDDEFEALFVENEDNTIEDISVTTDSNDIAEELQSGEDLLAFGDDDDFDLPVFDESDEYDVYDNNDDHKDNENNENNDNIVALSDHMHGDTITEKFDGESTIINFPQSAYTDTDSLLEPEDLLLDEDNDTIANDSTDIIDGMTAIDVMESTDFSALLNSLDEHEKNDDDSITEFDVNITQEIDTLLTDLGVNSDNTSVKVESGFEATSDSMSDSMSDLISDSNLDAKNENSFAALSMDGNADVDSLLRELDVGTHNIASEHEEDTNDNLLAFDEHMDNAATDNTASNDVLDHMQNLMTHQDLNLTGLNLDRARSLLAAGRLEEAQKAFEAAMPDAACQALLGQAAVALKRNDRGTAGSYLHQASSMLDEASQDWYEQLQFQYRGL